MNEKFSQVAGTIRGSIGLALIHRHRNLMRLAQHASLNSKIIRILWCLLYALAVGLVLLFLPQFARAGGPRYIAGVSYFDPGTTGVPLTWAQGAISYYTDQGNLSSILPGPSADAFVANGFSQWTSIPTAAVVATRAGQLGEDVSGANVIVNGNGSITMPSDVLPTAVGTPLGIVYDADGSVTSALLGQGAGDPANCFTNAVFGGVDNFATNAQFLHGLVILNGNCAQSSSQLPDVEYRLVRVLGRILGLDWSRPAPAETPSSFNTLYFGETRLDAQILQTTSFRLAISDYRGDGRPDYRYHARIFYGDSVTPARANVAGGTPLAVQGLGFQPNTLVKLGSMNAPQLALSSNQMLVNAPAMQDGLQEIVLSDAPTGAGSTMTGVLTYGAGPSDKIRLVSGSNPATPVGGQAPNPIRIQVVAPDGTTPVAGASVFLTSTPALTFSACSGGVSCTVLTDQTGVVSTQVTVRTAGVMTITAKLAPASYSSPKQVQTTLLGTSSSLDLSLASPYAWIAQGVTVGIPLTARALNNGVPISGTTIAQDRKRFGDTQHGVRNYQRWGTRDLHAANSGHVR